MPNSKLNALVLDYAKNFKLTERESAVFQQLVNRVINPEEIGKILNISLFTVNNHLKKILEKTHSKSKAELLAGFLLFLDEKKENQILKMIPKPRVMILDDELELAQMLHNYFSMRNCDSYIFTDTEKALDAVKKLKIDVIVTDIRMPKINGVTFLQEIRRHHYYDPGVVFISGYPEEYSTETLMDLGAFGFLEKPIDLEKLAHMVREYVYGNESPAPLLETIPPIKTDIAQQQLGFGGFFMFQDQIKGKDESLTIGQQFPFEITLPGDEKPRVLCGEVMWRNADMGGRLKYGVKFLDLIPEAKNKILENARNNNIISFIPRGE